jgi:hypothetical protein
MYDRRADLCRRAASPAAQAEISTVHPIAPMATLVKFAGRIEGMKLTVLLVF